MGFRLSAVCISASVSAIFVAGAHAQTVEETIKTALKHSPQITIGEADTDAAMADRFRAFGQLLPSVSASISAGRYTGQLATGMTVSAEIVTRRRSIAEYLLKPVARSVDMAFAN